MEAFQPGQGPKPDAAALLPPDEVIRPQGDLLREISRASGVSAGACYACKKCSAGCPLAFAMDLHPYQVVRCLQLGLWEPLINCRTIWICASCQTCLTRCPNAVDLPRLMDHLKSLVVKQGGESSEERVRLFHQYFLDSVRKRGRVFEGTLMARYMLATDGFSIDQMRKNARLGFEMLRRGRMKLIPSRVRDRGWLKEVFSGKDED
jgi:heterodisulfide reductase subunit C